MKKKGSVSEADAAKRSVEAIRKLGQTQAAIERRIPEDQAQPVPLAQQSPAEDVEALALKELERQIAEEAEQKKKQK